MSGSGDPLAGIESKVPELVVRKILIDGWDATQTDGITPEIHRGWTDPSIDVPEITISDTEESPRGGGDTGYISIAQDGRPSQEIGGTVRVNVWVDRDRLREAGATQTNAFRYSILAALEAKSCIEDAYDAPSSDHITYVSYLGRQHFVDSDADPVEHRQLVTVGYGYGPTRR